MATYRASSYNLINAARNVNADNGWGSYKWPGGVPFNLLGTFSYRQVNGAKQWIMGTVRRELVDLFTLAAEIADRKHGYQIWATHDGVGWGPWTYENRAIAGTNSASNHSRGRAWDVNAPNNGYANGFGSITSDIPPALVNDWESIGLSWGGRYGDAMHFEYAYTPADVAGHESVARSILGGKNLGTAPDKPSPSTAPDSPAETDWFDMATAADLDAAIERAIPKIAKAVWDDHFHAFAGGTASMGDIVAADYNEAISSRIPAIAAAVSDAVWQTNRLAHGSPGDVLNAVYDEAIAARK